MLEAANGPMETISVIGAARACNSFTILHSGSQKWISTTNRTIHTQQLPILHHQVIC